MHIIFIFIFAFTSFIQNSNAHEADWSWLKSFFGKSTNSAMSPRFEKFLASELPKYEADFGFKRHNQKIPLSEILMTALGGPPDDVQMPNDHTVTFSACRYHSCDEKGYFWADMATRQSVSAIIHYVFNGNFEKTPQLFLTSKEFNCDGYPVEAKSSIRNWLLSKHIEPSLVRCLEGSKIKEISF